MNRFLKRILIFSSPIIIYLLIAIYIDPFNVIHKEYNNNLSAVKSQISEKVNYPLYKLQGYSNHPTEIILLGDSRTNKLKSETFEELTKKNTTNLAFGGATLPEMIESFWYATTIKDFTQVYIGINFNLYNADNNMDRVTDALKLKNSPISYLFSQSCLKSTFLIIKYLIDGKPVEIEKPNMSKEEFWNYQLESSANNFYRIYVYPSSYFDGLKKISTYCKNKGIKLVFFIPPTHLDLQKKVNEFNLVKEEIRFKSDLNKLGVLYDFDYPNELTENKENFLDPFHFNDSIAKLVTKELVTGNTHYARKNYNYN